MPSPCTCTSPTHVAAPSSPANHALLTPYWPQHQDTAASPPLPRPAWTPMPRTCLDTRSTGYGLLNEYHCKAGVAMEPTNSTPASRPRRRGYRPSPAAWDFARVPPLVAHAELTSRILPWRGAVMNQIIGTHWLSNTLVEMPVSVIMTRRVSNDLDDRPALCEVIKELTGHVHVSTLHVHRTRQAVS
ncbi:hypothetical protein T440DRAFT_277981 [Plenodomus tracheiphilus IPT5]|uniref:Uncharacterized protein n=1 Tax=Plenodomus tracheiphilus IPT5 TaxID=1408161 RepID=A0A6A7AQG4_9PLEO|nr:hypothetical protein T440DRAFT_277981 [Plenodomus tracheiphilus IPT5]